MTMPSAFRLLKSNGSHPPPPESSYNTLAPALPPPNVTFVWISVTMGSSAPCTAALPARRQPPVTLPIIVWQPNVISVIDGDILTKFATFDTVEDAMPPDMWSITVLSTRLPNPTLNLLTGEPTRMMTTSTPLWMMTQKVRSVEPGARIYEGGNVMIFFLSQVFFLVSVVCCPYFHFAPLHKETNSYLLTFPPCSDSFIVPF